jgi:iron complex transport system substrate-binding protein
VNRRSCIVGLFLGWVVSLTPVHPALALVVVDDAGRSVEIPDRVDKVMAAGPPASVLLYALAPEKMAGWVRKPSAEDKAFLAAPYRDLPAHGRLTGRGSTASLDTVLELKPDLIIDVGTIDPTYVSLADRVQQQTGIPYILIGGAFGDTPATLRKVGAILGASDKAEELATYSETVFARVAPVLADVPQDKRPRVYYGRGPDGLETGLAGSINMEVLAAVGAENVAAEAGQGGRANVSIEQILRWNPEAIVTLDPTFARSVLVDPLWTGVEAVRSGKVYRAPATPFGWFDAPPGVNRLMGVSWLVSVLYPDKTTGSLRDETRDFYRLFYHVDLTEAQLDTLLAGAEGR